MVVVCFFRSVRTELFPILLTLLAPFAFLAALWTLMLLYCISAAVLTGTPGAIPACVEAWFLAMLAIIGVYLLIALIITLFMSAIFIVSCLGQALLGEDFGVINLAQALLPQPADCTAAQTERAAARADLEAAERAYQEAARRAERTRRRFLAAIAANIGAIAALAAVFWRPDLWPAATAAAAAAAYAVIRTGREAAEAEAALAVADAARLAAVAALGAAEAYTAAICGSTGGAAAPPPNAAVVPGASGAVAVPITGIGRAIAPGS